LGGFSPPPLPRLFEHEPAFAFEPLAARSNEPVRRMKIGKRKRASNAPIAKGAIRVSLAAFDHRILDATAREIIATARRTGSRVKGPIPLPTRIEKFTVNRSPHVDKKSREQFEMRTHKRLIDIIEVTPQTTDALMKLDLSAGVEIKVKV
jgi:small subunit ribosomal protein S10